MTDIIEKAKAIIDTEEVKKRIVTRRERLLKFSVHRRGDRVTLTVWAKPPSAKMLRRELERNGHGLAAADSNFENRPADNSFMLTPTLVNLAPLVKALRTLETTGQVEATVVSTTLETKTGLAFWTTNVRKLILQLWREYISPFTAETEILQVATLESAD